MDIRDYVRVLRKRWRLIVLCAAVAVAAASLATLFSPPAYKAEAQLFVSTSSTDTGSVAGLQQGGQFAQQRVKSYADIVNSRPVTEAVVRELGLRISPIELGKRIEASAPLDTVLINVDVTDPDPAAAQAIANAVAQRFTQVAADLETPPGGTTSPVKVSVVRPADLPAAPVSPRPKLNLALGLLVGLAIGVGTAVLRETLDTSVKNPQEIQDLIGSPTLGTIGYDPDAQKRPLIVQADPHSPRAEAFRQLRTNLQFVDIDSKPRSIVITSSLPGEGKSTTAVNLAIALTQAGLRVVLVEADLRRPRVAQYLGIEGAVGLTDVLVGRADLEDVLQDWGTAGLVVLPSGATPPNPSELLGSQQMRETLRALEDRADLVLLDAPPLLPVTDAAVLAAVASGALLIIRAGVTRREQAVQAAAILVNVDAHLYGAVLNMAPTKGPDAYQYGYGYGYAPEGTVPPGAPQGTGKGARHLAGPGEARLAEADVDPLSERPREPTAAGDPAPR